MAHSSEQRQVDGLRKLAKRLAMERNNLDHLLNEAFKEKIALEKENKRLAKIIDEHDEMIQCLSDDVDYYRSQCEKFKAMSWYRRIFYK